MTGKKVKPKTVKPGDFLVLVPPKKKKKDWKQQLQLVEILNAAFGGEDKRSKDQ